MSHTIITNPAFGKETHVISGFNLAPVANPFNSIFGSNELEEKEAQKIERLLVEHSVPGLVLENQLLKDAEEMKQLTSEIQSIGKQSLVLIGERVFRVRDILKCYKEGSFTQWLTSTFACKRTGYNYLTYYEFYKELPDAELKEGFKKLPQKSAYKLASRRGDIGVKSEIVRDYQDLSLEELDKIIEEMLPLESGDRRKKEPNDSSLIDRVLKSLTVLLKRKDNLSEENLSQIYECHALILEILKE